MSLRFGMYSLHQPTTAAQCQYCQRQNRHCAYAKLGTCGLQIRSMCLCCFLLGPQFLTSFNTTSSTREFKRQVLWLASESKSLVLGGNWYQTGVHRRQLFFPLICSVVHISHVCVQPSIDAVLLSISDAKFQVCDSSRMQKDEQWTASESTRVRFVISVVLWGNVVSFWELRPEVNWYTWAYIWVCEFMASWMLFFLDDVTFSTGNCVTYFHLCLCDLNPPQKKGRLYCFISFFAFMQVVNIGEFAVRSE